MERLISGFYRGKRVFVTGHTGFKGSWMCSMLYSFGAEVRGYALEPPTVPSLFDIAGIADKIDSVTGDIRELEHIKKSVADFKPEIVIHMAAQPLVIDSYKNPVYTYETNVMGTVNMLEAVREFGGVRSFVNVTTDKVYKNNEWEWGYRETDELNGYDPYSNSKSCSELVTDSYKKSFFADSVTAISTARAGNVIGGGDFADNRIIPDCIRAAAKGKVIEVRNPYSTRPFQHVLEPVFAYLYIAMKQYEDASFSGSYNIGPDYSDCVTAGRLADIFCSAWGDVEWKSVCRENAVHEAGFLKLDCSRIKAVFGLAPAWSIDTAVKKTVEWTRAWLAGDNINECMNKQIDEYLKEQI